MDNIFAGLPGVSKLIDNILIEADTMEQMEERLEKVLKQALEHDVTLSRSKTQFGQKVRFGGFVVESKDGVVSVSPSPDIADIKNFKTPTNKTEVRAYTGLAKQVTDFNPDLSQSIQTMYNLLKNNTTWDWNEEVNKEFEDSKIRLSKGQEIHPFNIKLPTRLFTDASRLNGLGFALMQKVSPFMPAKSLSLIHI